MLEKKSRGLFNVMYSETNMDRTGWTQNSSVATLTMDTERLCPFDQGKKRDEGSM